MHRKIEGDEEGEMLQCIYICRVRYFLLTV